MMSGFEVRGEDEAARVKAMLWSEGRSVKSPLIYRGQVRQWWGHVARTTQRLKATPCVNLKPHARPLTETDTTTKQGRQRVMPSGPARTTVGGK